MKIIEVKELAIPEVKVIKFARFTDPRGYFTELYRQSDMEKILPDFRTVQTNESHSKKGVVRGLHIQWNPYTGKLVRTVAGHMVDIVLDVRKNSPTFGKAIMYDMPSTWDVDYNEWIWVPIGFAHGNYYLEKTTIQYLCNGEYSPSCEIGISPLAKDIDWSVCDSELKNQFDQLIKDGVMISDKDRQGINSLEQWKTDPRSENFTFRTF